MTDKELLEFAAKAGGYVHYHPGDGFYVTWNPLTDDGDALRLAVKLRMDIAHFSKLVRADVTGYDECRESNGNDPYAATRRAIVRAAAEIGKAMP